MLELVSVAAFSGERRGWPQGVYIDQKKEGFWLKTPVGVEEIKPGDWVGTDPNGDKWAITTQKEKKRLSKQMKARV